VSGTLSGGVSGVGANMGMSHSREKHTVLTTLNGKQVNIDVAKDTTLRGASIAATDAHGNDNGNLKLKTNTLEVSSLNNTRNSKSLSAGINVGVSNQKQRDRANNKSTLSTVGIDFANDIGKGNVEVASVDKSNTKLLNRDVKNNEINIYNIKSHKGLKGSLDTRLLTKKGQAQIAEDVLKAGMIANTIKLIVTTDKVKATDFFKETDKANKTYEAVKAEVAKSPALAKALQSPKLSPQQKEAMLNDVTSAVMVKLGYKAYDNVIVATDAPGRDGQQVKGFYSTETKSAYINDKKIKDAKGLIAVAGHEATRAMDQQNGVDFNKNRKDRAKYANNYGENLASYTDMALNINGYDGGLASTNSHTGNRSEYVTANNQEFKGLDKSKGDNFIVIGTLAAATAAYVAYAGDGNPVKGVEKIGAGDDPLSKTIASGAEKAVKISYAQFPEATRATLDALGKVGEGVDAIVKYTDEKTGKVVSRHWSKLDKQTQDLIKGSGKIISIFVPGASVKVLARLKKVDVVKAAAKLPDLPSAKVLVKADRVVRDAKLSPAKRPSNQTVLGSYPDYVKLSDKLNARRFQIPPDIWKKMSPDQQWEANKKFLDRMITRGDEVILSNPVKNIGDATPSFRKELEYLISKGYKFNSNETRLIK